MGVTTGLGKYFGHLLCAMTPFPATHFYSADPPELSATPLGEKQGSQPVPQDYVQVQT